MRYIFLIWLILCCINANSQTWSELDQQTRVLIGKGDFKAALSTGETALKLAKNEFGADHSNYANSLSIMGIIYLSTNKFAQAESMFEEAKKIKEKTVGKTHPDYAKVLGNLATVHARTGEFKKAEEYFLEVKEILQSATGAKTPEYAVTIGNLANLYFDMGNYRKAEPMNLEAIELKRISMGDTSVEYAQTVSNLAVLYHRMGQIEKAQKMFLQVKDILVKNGEEKSLNYMLLLINLAKVYTRRMAYKSAEDLLYKAEDIAKSLYGEHTLEYANVICSFGSLYTSIASLNKNNYEFYSEAEKYYLRGIGIMKQVVGENRTEYLTNSQSLADIYRKTGKYKEAEEISLRVRSALMKIYGPLTNNRLSTSINLGLLYQDMGRYQEAEKFLLENTSLTLSRLKENFSILSEKEKANYISNSMTLIEVNNSFLFKNPHASSDMIKTNYNLGLYLKSLALSDTREMLNTVSHSGNESISQLFISWKDNRTYLAKQYSLPIGNRNKKLDSIEISTENLEKELARNSAEFRTNQSRASITFDEIQKSLSENEAALEFVQFRLYDREWSSSVIYAAYIVRKSDTIPHFISLCEEKKLLRLFDSIEADSRNVLHRLYRGVTVENAADHQFLGDSLYKLVWAPIEPYLKGVKKIFYSPAGALYNIAFHVLPVDRDKVLMEKYELRRFTSTREIVLPAEESEIKSIALFGNPQFDRLPSSRLKTTGVSHAPGEIIKTKKWSNLPGTLLEVQKIQQLFKLNKNQCVSYTGQSASEENLKALSNNSPEILHIATHGFYLSGNKPEEIGNTQVDQKSVYIQANDPLLRTGLILAGGNNFWSQEQPIEGQDDGVVTAYEISHLDLKNIELLVLSACETGLGDIKGSEGVYGLQRSFKLAGVKRMIVSLWKVPDAETAEFMEEFYKNLFAKQTINDAFYKAQTTMKNKYRNDPYKWAAWVLVR
jgi:CHAT domain-containing protein